MRAGDESETARADDWKDRALKLAVRVKCFAQGAGDEEEWACALRTPLDELTLLWRQANQIGKVRSAVKHDGVQARRSQALIRHGQAFHRAFRASL